MLWDKPLWYSTISKLCSAGLLLLPEIWVFSVTQPIFERYLYLFFELFGDSKQYFGTIWYRVNRHGVIDTLFETVLRKLIQCSCQLSDTAPAKWMHISFITFDMLLQGQCCKTPYYRLSIRPIVYTDYNGIRDAYLFATGLVYSTQVWWLEFCILVLN